jgi:gliding motility-associated-like protein
VPGAIQLSITYSSTVCSYANGNITVSAVGGTAPYQFSDDGVTFQSNGRFTGLYNGTYPVVVKDAAGLQNSTVITLNVAGRTTMLAIAAYVKPTGCGAADGSMTVQGYNPYGEAPPFLYSMDGVNYQSNNTFSNLSAGNYTFFVKDADGCIDTAYYPLFPVCPIQAVRDYSAVACTNEGHITISSVTGGTGPYSYSLNGGVFQTSPNFPGLSAGTYRLTIKDATGQTMLYSIPIFQACTLNAAAVPTDASCNNSDGTITVTQTGGTAPYTYSTDGTTFQSSNVFGGLAPGVYNITVDDASGLQTSVGANIYNNCSSRVTATVINTSCLGNNGQITATVINGTGPFTYSIDGVNYQSSNVFTMLPKGTYTVTAIDATNLKMTTIATVGAAPFIIPNVYALPASCSYDDGVIIITAPGPGPYQYSLNSIDWQSSNVFTGVPASDFTYVYLKDPYGCVTENSRGWVTSDCIIITAIAADAQCNGSTGTITVTGNGGVAPYSYSIDGVNFQTSNIFGNLPAGNYTITIKGANGALNNTSVTVKASCIQALAVATNATCGKSDGSITVTASNGAPPYQYSLDGINFINTGEFDGLVPGPYTITVKDANNGTAQVIANVSNIAGPVLTASASAASCQNNDGVILAVVDGGTAPFVFAVAQNGVPSSGLNGLSTGPYQVTVTDANGCVGTAMATVPLVNNLTVEVGSVQPVCEGAKLSLNATSAATSYSWSPSAGLSDSALPNPVLTASATQQYTVTASTGPCQATGSVIVTVLPAPVVTVSPDTTVCYGKSASLSGGGGGTYSWTPSTYLNNPQIAAPTVENPTNTITYHLSVTGTNGCTSLSPASVTVTVSAPAVVFAGDDTTVAIGEPLQLQAIDVNNTGFTNYSWSPADGLNNPAIADPVAVLQNDETYTVTAYSDAGCEGSAVIRVKVYAGPNIYVPNAFTPNGDGHNDILRAIPVGISQFRFFRIYNRYGQLVFSTVDAAKGWDGLIAGKQQGTATFVWQAEGVDYQGRLVERKGTVVLVR